MQLTLPQDLFGEVHLAFLSTWPGKNRRRQGGVVNPDEMSYWNCRRPFVRQATWWSCRGVHILVAGTCAYVIPPATGTLQM